MLQSTFKERLEVQIISSTFHFVPCSSPTGEPFLLLHQSNLALTFKWTNISEEQNEDLSALLLSFLLFFFDVEGV